MADPKTDTTTVVLLDAAGRLTSLPGYGAPLWLRWQPCSVKFDGRVRDAWRRPGPAIMLSAAAAKRQRKMLGLTKVSDRPPGPYLAIMLDRGDGYRTVPLDAMRRYTGPDYMVPSMWDAARQARANVQIGATLKATAR